jgi:hypothetical protein
MSQNGLAGLIIRNTSNKEENMERVRETIDVVLDDIKAMGEEAINKMSPDDFNVMVNNRILEAVKALNIEGLSVVPASEAGLDMMEGVNDRDRAEIRKVIESAADGSILEMPNFEDRKTAVKGVIMALATYAMSTVNRGTISGAPEIFHDFGQILINALTEIPTGAKNFAGANDSVMPEAAKVLNRIAVISAIKMLLYCDADQAKASSIDQDAIREDLAAVLDNKGEDRVKELVGFLSDIGTAHQAKANNSLH